MDDESNFDLGWDHPGPGDHERNRAIIAIRRLDVSWSSDAHTLSLSHLRWRPDLTAAPNRVLHLTLTGEIPAALGRRLRAANDANFSLTVALGSSSVDTATLCLLQEIDAQIIAVNWEQPKKARPYRSVADWIASERISLAPDDLRTLADSRLRTALAESTSVKGRYYEETLCLIFSQVSWLTVDEHAYRNITEEIDLVLGIHATGHVAALVKGAVAIATAKNERKATGSATVKYLKEQIANRKGRCELGFLCSASTISTEAKTEILRGSQSSSLLIAELDYADLTALIEHADNLDGALESVIRRAVNA